MLHKDYDRKGSVGKTILVVSLKGFGARTNWLAVNRQTLEFGSVVRRWPADNGVSAEAEESSQLEAVTKKHLVKTLHTGKESACVLVIRKVWRTAMAYDYL
jgi:hypothetical protein